MPRSSKAEQAAKRRVVARGLAAGKKNREIAKEAGVSQRHVERLAAEPETKFLVANLMRPHHANLAKLMKKAVTVVGGALDAKNAKKQPLHDVRLMAVRRLRDLCLLAQGDNAADEGDRGLVTWDEFVLLYRSRTAEA